MRWDSLMPFRFPDGIPMGVWGTVRSSPTDSTKLFLNTCTVSNSSDAACMDQLQVRQVKGSVLQDCPPLRMPVTRPRQLHVLLTYQVWVGGSHELQLGFD